MIDDLQRHLSQQHEPNTACGFASQVSCLLAVAMCLSVFPARSFAQDVSNDSATVVTLSGKKLSGELQTLTSDSLTIAGKTEQRSKLDDVLSVQFRQRNLPVRETGPTVFFSGGDRLSLRPSSIDEDTLVGSWDSYPAWPPVKIPLERIQAIEFEKSQDAKTRHRMTATLLELNEKRDTIILRNGDRLGGRLVRLANNSLDFEGPVGKLAIPHQDIRALSFNTELTTSPKAVGQRVLLELSDGSRLTVSRAILVENGRFEIESQFGLTLQIPASAVVSMRFIGRRASYLSDMNVADYHYTPFFNDRWPLRRDRNVNGGPLRLDGREYAKGLGLHSQSAVSYKLDGNFRQFRAKVGIDDSAGRKGSVRFAVQLDGRPVFRSQLVTGADKPVDVGPIDVRGKKRLTLIVEFGDLGDILDHADWCDAILVR